MRYEGKLYFKQISHKNITLTLASRHQHWLAYHLHSEMMFTPELVCGPITSCTKLNEESIQLQLLIQQCVQPITSSHWIKVNGTLQSTTEGKPNFSKVEKIITIDLQEAYLLMSKCHVLFYEPHLLAYAIDHANSTCKHMISVANLKHPSILHSTKTFLSTATLFHLLYFLN